MNFLAIAILILALINFLFWKELTDLKDKFDDHKKEGRDKFLK